MLVGAHDGAVNHGVFIIGIGSQKLEELLPHTLLGPSAEPPMGVLPITELFGQIAPRNSGPVAIDHRLDESTVVLGGYANMTDPARKQVLDPFPLIIAQSISGHRSAFSES